MQSRVIVVGAGLAGLTCARRLLQDGLSCVVVDAADAIGGRVRTEIVDGFPLDRGFQVLLTAYPEARAALDYEGLHLHRFYAGALAYFDGQMHRVADPWRHPADAIATLRAPVGSLVDKARVALLRLRLAGVDADALLARPETTTAERLRQLGFSDTMVRRFWRPFFAGVFLDPALATSSRMMEFTFSMFAGGDVAVPDAGMGAIPAQLAAAFPDGTIRLGVPVERIEAGSAILASGGRLSADAVVVATDAVAAARLTGSAAPKPGRRVVCVYFKAPAAPVEPYTLVLNGEGRGPINNLSVRGPIAGQTKRAGEVLVGATLLEPAATDEKTLVAATRQQLTSWFGAGVSEWTHLRTYDIAEALADQSVGSLDPSQRQARVAPGLYVCGDHRHSGSIHGAMASGRLAAEAVLRDLRG